MRQQTHVLRCRQRGEEIVLIQRVWFEHDELTIQVQKVKEALRPLCKPRSERKASWKGMHGMYDNAQRP